MTTIEGLPADVRAASQCEGKLRHESERRALRGAQISANKWGVPVFTYECDICQGWHSATSNKPPVGGFPKPAAVSFPKGAK